jgi:glyoxylate reductase
MKYKVFVTRQIPDDGINILKKDKRIDLEIYKSDLKIPRKELLKRIKGKDIVLSILTERIDKTFFKTAGDKLKMVANYAVGYDNIDLTEANKHNVTVTNTPHDKISESVAEHTIALMFAVARRICESDKFTRAGKYKNWGPRLLLGTDFYGKTIGIIGTGRIGTAVVNRLHDGFKMKVIYHDIKRNPALEKTTGAKYKSLNELLKQSDFVSLHVPLIPKTHHLISTKEFKLMKKTAFLINTARGPVVHEKALLTALKRNEIAGVGMDVYECEPLIDCNTTDKLSLAQMDNAVLTPHTASATLEARQAMSKVAAQNIIAFINGKVPPNKVN